jgi:hypothetical protein
MRALSACDAILKFQMFGVHDIVEGTIEVPDDALYAIRPGTRSTQIEIALGISLGALIGDCLHLGSRIVREQVIGDRTDYAVTLIAPCECP